MEVENGNVVVNANICQGSYDVSSFLPQMFFIDVAESSINDDNYHQLLPLEDFSLCVEVVNASNSNGADIKVFYSNPGYGAQSFAFISNGDGTFRIQPYLSDSRVIGVENNSTADQANVELATWSGHDSQKWILKRVWPTDTTYYSMNWSYFFHGDDAEEFKRISQRFSNSVAGDHTGIDIPADTGTPIYSPCAGKVLYSNYEGTMGYYVIIETTPTDESEEPLIIRLMHMQSQPLVSVGANVTANTKLGYVGNTGNSQGEHLHVDINDGSHINGSQIQQDLSSAINPESFYPQILFIYGLSRYNTTFA